MRKDCWSKLGGQGKGTKDCKTLVRQQIYHTAQGKGSPSKKVKCFKCGGMGHIPKVCRSVARLDVAFAKRASSNERVEEVVTGLFPTGLERHSELKSSFECHERTTLRLLHAIGNRRISTILVDNGAAAGALQLVSSSSLRSGAEVPESCEWWQEGVEVDCHWSTCQGFEGSWGPSTEFARDSEHQQLE